MLGVIPMKLDERLALALEKRSLMRERRIQKRIRRRADKLNRILRREINCVGWKLAWRNKCRQRIQSISFQRFGIEFALPGWRSKFPIGKRSVSFCQVRARPALLFQLIERDASKLISIG